MKFPRNSAAGLLFVLAAVLASAPAFGQGYPVKPVRIVVPYAAGGTLDVPARILAQQLAAQIGVQFLVDNRPGAGGNIGVEHVVGAAPDGYTLLVTGNNIPIGPALYKNAHFDPNASFTHIAGLVVMPSALIVSAQSPITSIADLITRARSRPDVLTYGSPGNGTPTHLAAELLKQRVGMDVRHVPYRGAAPAITDLLGGHIDLISVGMSSVFAQIRSGHLRALGVYSAERLPELPNVPTIGETVQGFSPLVTWLGIAGPAAMPEPVVKMLSEEIRKALAYPAVEKKLKELGMTPSYMAPAVVTARVREETGVYARIIEKAGITVD